jgi:hypothetical protein
MFSPLGTGRSQLRLAVPPPAGWCHGTAGFAAVDLSTRAALAGASVDCLNVATAATALN